MTRGTERPEEPEIAEAVASHAARSEHVLRRLEELGASLDEPCYVDCFFEAATEGDADALVARLQRGGFEMAERAPAALDGTSAVHGIVMTTPRQMGNDRFTEMLVRIAARHRARYDGWGTAVGGVS